MIRGSRNDPIAPQDIMTPRIRIELSRMKVWDETIAVWLSRRFVEW